MIIVKPIKFQYVINVESGSITRVFRLLTFWVAKTSTWTKQRDDILAWVWWMHGKTNLIDSSHKLGQRNIPAITFRSSSNGKTSPQSMFFPRNIRRGLLFFFRSIWGCVPTFFVVWRSSFKWGNPAAVFDWIFPGYYLFNVTLLLFFVKKRHCSDRSHAVDQFVSEGNGSKSSLWTAVRRPSLVRWKERVGLQHACESKKCRALSRSCSDFSATGFSVFHHQGFRLHHPWRRCSRRLCASIGDLQGWLPIPRRRWEGWIQAWHQ